MGELAALSVTGVYQFLLTVVAVAILGVAIVVIWKAAKGTHSHAFSSGIAIIVACVFVALAGSVVAMQATGNSILSMFGIS